MHKGIKRIIINKKKRGFTLIELLAVIVMIAIIMVITIPTILNSMSSSKQKAFNTAAEAIKKHLFSNYEACKLDNTDLVNYDTAIFNSECNLYGEDLSSNLILNSGYSRDDIEDVVIGGKDGDYQIRVIANKTGKFGNVEDYTSGNVVYRQWSLNGGDPDLSNGLIPVVYDENGGYWKVANISNKWYNYSKKEQWWANAVSVHPDKRSKYFLDPDDETSYYVDEKIDDTDLLAMFVWIPRFSYTIGCTPLDGCLGYKIENASDLEAKTPGAIDIKFVSKDSKEMYSGDSPTYTYEKDGEGFRTDAKKPENYYTHPAFTFGDDELSGIWVGKFETSVETTSGCYSFLSSPNVNGVKSECSESKINPVVLPDVLSLVGIEVKEKFKIAQKFSNDSNIYGITKDTNSHMMKNSEWAAVAYLSQSEYGKYGNSNYLTDNKKVYINNSKNNYGWTRYTGRSIGIATSGSSVDGFYRYDGTSTSADRENDKLYGTGASTTGNIYGVYDMSGGAGEYVAACYGNSCDITTDLKYVNIHELDSNVVNSHNNKNSKTVGYAMSETNGWYGTTSNVLGKKYIIRGSSDRGGQSLFYSYYNELEWSTSASFRVVLSK